jgi:signal transduction histidine kinase
MTVSLSSRRVRSGLLFPVSRLPMRPIERRALGAELHDRLCQEFSGLAMRSAALAKAIPEGKPGRKEAIALSRGYARCRRISNELVAGLLPAPVNGLASALRSLAAQLRRQSGVPCAFSGRDVPMDSETAAHLYRIAQEAARNALRHGRPARVRIALARTADGRNELRIQDDGAGLAPRAGRKGFGVSIMRFRANLIGGELEIRSDAGAGCTVACVWPSAAGRP